jgi:hypothetical protein
MDCDCTLCCVPMAGIFDKRLSLVDICHVMEMVNLYQYSEMTCAFMIVPFKINVK